MNYDSLALNLLKSYGPKKIKIHQLEYLEKENV